MTTKFQILKSKQFAYYTKYTIAYNGKKYVCNFNGGLPKLEGIRLSEGKAVALANVIEDYFLSNL